MKFWGFALAALPALVLGQNITLNNNNSSSTAPPVLPVSGSVAQTILIIARDAAAAASGSSGLNGYGIPYQTLIVPSSGAALPALNSSAGGNFGGIIVVSMVSYDYGSTGGGFKSALTTDQWNTLYNYQTAYGVRMVQYDVYPGPAFGATALGGCCNTGVEQLMSFTNTKDFPLAGINTWAGVSTSGLYHYPAQVSDANTTEIAQFAPNANFATNSTAAVINNYNGRQQMAFFIGIATEWSATSNFMQHAAISWLTRSLYAGFRRVNFNTQIDDVFLETDMYYPNGTAYRTTPNDFAGHAAWVPTIQAKMNTGSWYRPELGHNGNGNIIYGNDKTTAGPTSCLPGAIDTGTHADTALEFQKPLGSGTDAWPKTPTTYPFTTACTNLDPLKQWFAVTGNRDAFLHISHTFSHYELNNATYSDALKEIQFNQAWLQQQGFSAGQFTSNGLIPPAITGLHNGDVLRAWKDAGLTNCVGDNTRPVLRNTQNQMWPFITNMAANGFDGFQVIPRWATRIYYNCDTPACTTKEWIDTSAGAGTFDDLLSIEKSDTMRHLFGLYRDGYMFHQANLRLAGMAPTTINGKSATLSIFQAWVETVVQEFTRLVNWPMLTLKQSDLATAFVQRMTRDACKYKISTNSVNKKITTVSVTATGNTCSAPIPVTLPGKVTNTQGFTTEQVGNDPLTIWVKLSGRAVTFTLATPIPW